MLSWRRRGCKHCTWLAARWGRVATGARICYGVYNLRNSLFSASNRNFGHYSAKNLDFNFPSRFFVHPETSPDFLA